MDHGEQPALVIRFGVFEINLDARELRKQGLRVRVQEQPLLVLAALLEQPGRTVSREELQRKIWSDGTFVDFDRSINKAINRLREVLGDAPDNPRFIETVPRQGYRFIAPVDKTGTDAGIPRESDPSPELCATQASGPPAEGRPGRAGFRHIAVSSVVLVLLIAAGFMLWHRLSGTLEQGRIKSLAVLPLENLSGDPAQEYFADGMTDELITSLGRITDLRVISRTSIMRYKGVHRPLPEIARDLGVDAVMEGSVLRAGGKVRISARLLLAGRDSPFWSERYERDTADVIALQSDVAQAITGQIHARLIPNEHNMAPQRSPASPVAYEAYLKGRYLWNRRLEDDLNHSIEYFKQAIQIDPQYALSYSGIADSYVLLGILGFRPSDQVFPKARASAERALELDPTLAEAHTSLGEVRKDYDWDWYGAEREFRRAIELNPNYPVVHHFNSQLLSMLARHREAINEIENARHLDPLSYPINAYVAYIYLAARQYDRAITEARKAIDLEPNLPLAHWHLARAYQAQKRIPEAIEELEGAVRLSGRQPMFEAASAFLRARTGDRAGAVAILKDLRERARKRYVSPYDFAVVYAGLGDKKSALDSLDRAFDTRIMRLTAVGDPEFDELSAEPRYKALLQQLRLPARNHRGG